MSSIPPETIARLKEFEALWRALANAFRLILYLVMYPSRFPVTTGTSLDQIVTSPAAFKETRGSHCFGTTTSSLYFRGNLEKLGSLRLGCRTLY